MYEMDKSEAFQLKWGVLSWLTLIKLSVKPQFWEDRFLPDTWKLSQEENDAWKGKFWNFGRVG